MKRISRKPRAESRLPTKRRVEKASAHENAPTDNPFATFLEWCGEADEKAYADL
jgi:hypothetical protein